MLMSSLLTASIQSPGIGRPFKERLKAALVRPSSATATVWIGEPQLTGGFRGRAPRSKIPSNWLVRIVTGEEVIRRHCKAPKDADEQTLRSVAKKTIQEEGYEPDVADLSIRR